MQSPSAAHTHGRQIDFRFPAYSTIRWSGLPMRTSILVSLVVRFSVGLCFAAVGSASFSASLATSSTTCITVSSAPYSSATEIGQEASRITRWVAEPQHETAEPSAAVRSHDDQIDRLPLGKRENRIRRPALANREFRMNSFVTVLVHKFLQVLLATFVEIFPHLPDVLSHHTRQRTTEGPRREL
jgi:hypothetical protein